MFAISVSVPAIAAGQGVPQPHAPVSTTEGDIAKLRLAYAEAYNAKDAKAVVAMYTADAVVIGVDGSTLTGAAAIAERFGADAANWGHLIINSTSLRIHGGTAVDVGTATLHPMTGGEMVSRYLAVLRHGVNGWKLEYASNTPVGKP